MLLRILLYLIKMLSILGLFVNFINIFYPAKSQIFFYIYFVFFVPVGTLLRKVALLESIGLIKVTGAEFPHLTFFGALVFYGSLLVLTFIAPYFFKKK